MGKGHCLGMQDTCHPDSRCMPQFQVISPTLRVNIENLATSFCAEAFYVISRAGISGSRKGSIMPRELRTLKEGDWFLKRDGKDEYPNLIGM